MNDEISDHWYRILIFSPKDQIEIKFWEMIMMNKISL